VLTTVRAADLSARRVAWLVEPVIPLGAITVLAGDPGLGKSLLTVKLAADLSSGTLPTGSGDVILLTAEDSLEHVVIPRLVFAGADLERVHFPAVEDDGYSRQPLLPDVVPQLHELVVEKAAKLVVIDPLTAHLAQSVDPFKDQKIRLALAPLAKMAEQTQSAVLVVSHLNKGQSSEPLIRLGGSIGLAAAARSVLLLGRDPKAAAADREQRRVLAHVKTNLGKLGESRSLTLRPGSVAIDGSTIATAKVAELGSSRLSGRELLVPAAEEDCEVVHEAVEFLRSELRDGPKSALQLEERAKQAGLSWDTVKSHKRRAGVASKKEKGVPNGAWYWELEQADSEALAG
jgi:putative DNA primase/helicase